MKSTSHALLEIIEETKQQFFDVYGKNCDDEKRLFINWYVKNYNAPFRVLINDLSEYYLHISEETILKYLNEKGS